MSKKIICTVCPLGCNMEVQIKGRKIIKVVGNRCKKGLEYAKNEIYSPGRILTSTVRTNNPEVPLIPIYSEKQIPKEKIMVCMKEIAKMRIDGPIESGEIVIKDILNLGVNMLASRSVFDR
jgi:CxxC motif-containing protein